MSNQPSSDGGRYRLLVWWFMQLERVSEWMIARWGMDRVRTWRIWKAIQ